MPLPTDYGTGVVTGTFTDTNGDPVVGTISFTPSASRLLGTGAVILGDPVIVELDEEGSISVTLPASDDPNVNPTDFTYRVDETFVGVVGSTYFIDVLEGTTLDLSDVAVPGTVNNGTVIWGNEITGVIVTDVAFRPVDTGGLYPASDIDPINDTAAWVTAGGPAFFHIEPGQLVGINNINFDPTTTGAYDWDGTTFTRAEGYTTTASIDRKMLISHVYQDHLTGAPVTTPLSLFAMCFADDPDGTLGVVEWSVNFAPDILTVLQLLSACVPATRTITAGTGLSGGGTLAADRTLSVSYGTTAGTAAQGNDARLSDARTPTAHKTTHATGGSDALAPSDIGAVPTSRTIAGLDLTADRSASAVAAALPMWQTIANTTLGSASGSQSFNITGYRFVRITVAARSNRNGSIDSIRLRFNGDTGSNYSTNTTAFTTSVSALDIAGENTNTDRSGYAVIQFGYMAGSWLTGTVMGTGPSSTATTAASSLSNGFAWKGATSAAPTSIEVYTAIGQFVAGSSFLVEGRV
jgi:hypothetical protein